MLNKIEHEKEETLYIVIVVGLLFTELVGHMSVLIGQPVPNWMLPYVSYHPLP